MKTMSPRQLSQHVNAQDIAAPRTSSFSFQMKSQHQNICSTAVKFVIIVWGVVVFCACKNLRNATKVINGQMIVIIILCILLREMLL